MEELIWSKLYILRIDRADWPDILGLLYARGGELDWDRLVANLGEDLPVMASIVNLFRWLCPGRASRLPDHIWAPMGLVPPSVREPEIDYARVALFKLEHLFAGDTP